MSSDVNQQTSQRVPPSTAQVLAFGEMNESNRDMGASVISDHSPLLQIKTNLQVCIGELVISVGELLAAKEHQVLRLNHAIDQPVDLLLEGQVVARGQLVAVDENFGIRITELPVGLKA